MRFHNTTVGTTSSSTNLYKSDRTAVVIADLFGYKFSCRMDSGADTENISDIIVNYLGDQGAFIPTRSIRPMELSAINGSLVECSKKAQLCPLIQTSAGPCRLRNVKANIIKSSGTYICPSTACSGEIVLENPLLRAADLNFEDFFIDSISQLSSIDLGSLIPNEAPGRPRKFEVRLHKSAVAEFAKDAKPISVSSLINNGKIPLKDDFWKSLLDGKSLDCQSFYTLDFVYTPNRVLHVATNTFLYFKLSRDYVSGHLNLIYSLADILVHGRVFQKWLKSLHNVFQLCKNMG